MMKRRNLCEYVTEGAAHRLKFVRMLYFVGMDDASLSVLLPLAATM